MGRFSCFNIPAIAKIATWWSGVEALGLAGVPLTLSSTQTQTDLSYVDGVVREALSEVQDAIGGEGVVISELQRQQICSHVLKLPGPERPAHGRSVTQERELQLLQAWWNLQISVLQAVQQVVDQLLVFPVEPRRASQQLCQSHYNARVCC